MTSHAEDTYRQGLDLHKVGRLAEAWALYHEVLRLRPDHGQALHQLGVIALQSNRPQLAEELIGKAARLESKSADIHLNRGNALHELGRFEAALACFDRAIKLKRNFADAHNNRGVALRSLSRLDAALDSYNRALALRPGFADALNNRGIVLADLKRFAAAVESYDRALELKPGHALICNNRGIALAELRRHEEALASYELAISRQPDFADAHNNRGVVLAELGRHEEALASYERAIALNRNHADAYSNRGNVLRELKRHAAAIASFDQAIALNPGHAVAFDNRGIALAELRRYEEALASYDRAIALRPGYAEAHNNRGNSLRALRLTELAVASYDKAIAANPDYAGAHNNRGNALRELRQYEAAIVSFDRALELDPDFSFLRGMRLHTKLYLCDWRNLGAEAAELIEGVERGRPESNPLSFLAISGSARLQQEVASVWARRHYPITGMHPPIGKRARGEKLRVGYFSADFRDHAVSLLTARLFEIHDRSRFEWVGFSLGPDTQDPMRKRMEAAFDRFIDVRSRSDEEIVQLARSTQIDIAVDLGGYTQDCRPGIFARRAAPLQVSYLGYPGTMGAGFIDYLIADPTLVTPQSQGNYCEKIIYLPHSYLPSDSERCVAEKLFGREELGLPSAGFVFCCFNNSYKITPEIFAVWMRVLARVEGSVLWLSGGSSKAMQNLRREAQQRGVNGDRLIFADRLPSLALHLARQRAADLFLDTLPYNAHTTASDALWAGLPLLTCIGEAFAGRVGASLLTALGLPELIAADLDQYERLAIELATDGDRLAAIRDQLGRRRLTSPLFDTRLLAQHLESAYSIIYERYQADAPTGHIHVGPAA